MVTLTARRTSLLVPLTLFSALASSCAMEVVSEEEAVALQSTALFADSAYFWPNAGLDRVDINVCWENLNTTASWRNYRRSAVESSWSRYARVNFYQWDQCTSGEAGIHVRGCLRNDPSIGCESHPGSQAWPFGSLINGEDVDSSGNGIELATSDPNTVAIHEFGHALGFYHDWERPDYTGGCPVPTPGNEIEPTIPMYYGGVDVNSAMTYAWCDPGGGSLSPNDIAAAQLAYGRRLPGTLISPQANCASSHYASGNGTGSFLWDCDEANDDQEWSAPTSTGSRRYLQLNGSSGGLCLAADSAAAGQALKLKTCTTNRDWIFERMSLIGPGGMCFELPGGNTTNGTQVTVSQCTGNTEQQWSIHSGGTIRYGGLTSSKCLRQVGSNVVIWSCGSSNQNFSFTTAHRLTINGSCVGVQNLPYEDFANGVGLYTNGSTVGVSACEDPTVSQNWNIAGTIKYGANHGLCLTRNGGTEDNGTNLSLQTCGGAGQGWDYYFKF